MKQKLNFEIFLSENIRKGALNNKPKVVLSQPAITCSKLTMETLEQGVKYVQS